MLQSPQYDIDYSPALPKEEHFAPKRNRGRFPVPGLGL